MQRLNVKLTCSLWLLLSVAMLIVLFGCASQPIVAPCPAVPPRPQVVLPQPGDLTQDLERILGQQSPPSSSSLNPLSLNAELF